MLAKIAFRHVVGMVHVTHRPYIRPNQARYARVLEGRRCCKSTSQIKCTMNLILFKYHLSARDPRRSKPLVSWILSLPLDLQSESAFASTFAWLYTTPRQLNDLIAATKSLAMVGCYIQYIGYRDPQSADAYFNLFLENSNTSYAEARTSIRFVKSALIHSRS